MPVMQKCFICKLDYFLMEVRSQVVLAKAFLNTLFESIDKSPIVDKEKRMPLELEPVHKNTMAMHICSKKQTDKTCIDSDPRVMEKEKKRLHKLKFGYAYNILKLQKNYRVEHVKNQLLITVLKPVLTLEHQDKVAQLYGHNSMFSCLITFCLDVKYEAQCNIDLMTAAHKWEEKLTKKLKQVEQAGRHCQTAQLLFNKQIKKYETLKNLIKAGKTLMLNRLLGENLASRRQEAPSILNAEFAVPASSSANEDQKMIDKDRQFDEKAHAMADYK